MNCPDDNEVIDNGGQMVEGTLHSGRVNWSLPDNPRLTGPLADAGFTLEAQGAVVIISSDVERVPVSGLCGPRHIIILPPEASAEAALDAGAFRVLRAPVDPDVLVTQVQRATTDWHRSRRMFLHSDIVDRVHDVVVCIDMDDRIASTNSAASQVLSSSDGGLVGQHIDTILADATEAADDELVKYAIERGGNTRWLKGFWRRISDPQGRSFARVLVARDVTREQSLRRDLVRSGALAELGMLAAEVAHEVNNPATYLMTNLSILRDDIQMGTLDIDQAAELVDECLDGVSRITEVVRRMRTLTSGHSDEALDMIDLSWVVRDACRIAGLRVKYKAELHIHDAEMPQIYGSAKRIGQVVLNLVVNAADALGGQIDPMPRIDVTLGQDDQGAWVDVRDNGPGIPEKIRDQLFEAFVTSKSSEGGTGLGLAVSATIADEHGGRLELCQHDGPGAWFRLWLPLPAK